MFYVVSRSDQRIRFSVEQQCQQQRDVATNYLIIVHALVIRHFKPQHDSSIGDSLRKHQQDLVFCLRRKRPLLCYRSVCECVPIWPHNLKIFITTWSLLSLTITFVRPQSYSITFRPPTPTQVCTLERAHPRLEDTFRVLRQRELCQQQVVAKERGRVWR